MKTHEHNTRYLDDTKKKFITNEEINQICNYESKDNMNIRTLH